MYLLAIVGAGAGIVGLIIGLALTVDTLIYEGRGGKNPLLPGTQEEN